LPVGSPRTCIRFELLRLFEVLLKNRQTVLRELLYIGIHAAVDLLLELAHVFTVMLHLHSNIGAVKLLAGHVLEFFYVILVLRAHVCREFNTFFGRQRLKLFIGFGVIGLELLRELLYFVTARLLKREVGELDFHVTALSGFRHELMVLLSDHRTDAALMVGGVGPVRSIAGGTLPLRLTRRT
jgi:hypothetical protein